MRNVTKNVISSSIALLLCSSALAASCPNFSGTFEQTGSTTAVTLTVTQLKCESATFSYYYPSTGETLGKTYPMDNQRRETDEDTDLIVYETSGIVDGELQNLVEDFYKATGVTIKALAHFQINQTGELVNENDAYNASGQIDETDTNYYQRTN